MCGTFLSRTLKNNKVKLYNFRFWRQRKLRIVNHSFLFSHFKLVRANYTLNSFTSSFTLVQIGHFSQFENNWPKLCKGNEKGENREILGIMQNHDFEVTSIAFYHRARTRVTCLCAQRVASCKSLTFGIKQIHRGEITKLTFGALALRQS